MGRRRRDTHHLPNTVKAFAMKLERLIEQHSVLRRPFVRKRRKIGQVMNRLLQVVLVPEQHPQSLLPIVAVSILGHRNVVLNYMRTSKRVPVKQR